MLTWGSLGSSIFNTTLLFYFLGLHLFEINAFFNHIAIELGPDGLKE